MTHEDIAKMLNALHRLPGMSDWMVGKHVKYRSGEQGVCLYVERVAVTDMPAYCLVKHDDNSGVRLWWLNDTTIT